MSLVVSGGQTIQVASAISSALVDPGGVLEIVNGGIASFSVVSGIQLVASGAAASFTAVSGGKEVVAGGTAVSTTVNNTGDQIVASGGIASYTTVSTGNQEISAGGTAIDATLNAYARQFVYSGGSAVGTVVTNGAQTVSSGGFASLTVVDPSGAQVVSAGGTAVGTTLSGSSYGGFTVSAWLRIDGGEAIISAADIQGPAAIVFYGQGGTLEISGTTMPSVTIGGFDGSGATDGDVIDLASVPFDPAGSVSLGSGNVLSVTEQGQDYQIAFDPTQNFAGERFRLAADGAGGTDVNIACFAAGTRIATPDGATDVASLRPGDAVRARRDAAWETHVVQWVGRVTVDLRRHPRPERAAPIRVRRDAFAPGMPHRDLLISPDHALFIDGALIQAQALVNGATIAQEFRARVTYVHVELERHALLLAEGVPAESYLDTGNRAVFAGEAGVRALHPELAPTAAWRFAWQELACAPLLLGGTRVAAAQARLLARAEEVGHVRAGDPALSVSADGRRIASVAGGSFAVAPGTREVRLRSRSFVPRWFGAEDSRRLGVAVTALPVGGAELPASAFAAGWHAPEQGWRWTDGDGVLILPRHSPPVLLTIRAAGMGASYWREIVTPRAAGRCRRIKQSLWQATGRPQHVKRANTKIG